MVVWAGKIQRNIDELDDVVKCPDRNCDCDMVNVTMIWREMDVDTAKKIIQVLLSKNVRNNKFNSPPRMLWPRYINDRNIDTILRIERGNEVLEGERFFDPREIYCYSCPRGCWNIFVERGNFFDKDFWKLVKTSENGPHQGRRQIEYKGKKICVG